MGIVVLSNRSPFLASALSSGRKLTSALGGVAGVLRQVLSRTGGTWICWDGAFRDDRSSPDGNHRSQKYNIRSIRLSDEEVHGYYLGFSNKVLWPICHSFYCRCGFDQRYWPAYKRVNETFAKTAQKELGRECLLWVHDYHLALVPQLIRANSRRRKIGFFWHIPFPDSKTLDRLPHAHEVVAGLLASDVIGFHTQSYAANFMDAAGRLPDCVVNRVSGQIDFKGHAVSVVVHPLGIDAEYFASIAASPTTVRAAKDIRSRVGSRHLAVCVDRVDYTKGLPERLSAIDALFQSRSELRGRFSLLQITAPSREAIADYRQLNANLKIEITRINRRYATGDWQPVLHVDTGVPQSELVAYYQAADLALVTPLKDGMNLVAKEYIASQTDNHGMLILSRYAGAADSLGEDAVLIDPRKPESLVFGIQRALESTDFERALRMKRLRQKVARYDLHWWASSFLKRLDDKFAYPLKLSPTKVNVTA